MNRPDQVIYLISVTTAVNDMGDTIETKTKRLVFGEKKSIRQSEFYQAQATGLRPELAFAVWTREYAGEGKLEHNGKEYNIIRIFEPNSEDTELTCQGIVNGAI